MLIKENSVLVVVDMQKGFLNAHSSHIIPNVVQLVCEFGRRMKPVVFTTFFNTDNSQFERLIGWRKHYSSPETDLVNELNHFDRIEIRKNFYTGITDRMKVLIYENGWRTIFLCGVATESCVLKTAVDAFEQDLIPIVISDACGSDRGEEMHRAGLAVLSRFIGAKQIISTAELLDALT